MFSEAPRTRGRTETAGGGECSSARDVRLSGEAEEPNQRHSASRVQLLIPCPDPDGNPLTESDSSLRDRTQIAPRQSRATVHSGQAAIRKQKLGSCCSIPETGNLG